MKYMYFWWGSCKAHKLFLHHSKSWLTVHYMHHTCFINKNYIWIKFCNTYECILLKRRYKLGFFLHIFCFCCFTRWHQVESLPDHGHTISVTFWYKVGNQKLPNTDLVPISILSYMYICTCTECVYRRS